MALRSLLLILVVLTGVLSPAAAQDAAPREAEVLSPLLDVLKDEAARTRLIEALEAEEPAAEAAPAAPEPPRVSLSRQLATATKSIAENGAMQLQDAWRQIQNADAVYRGLRGTELQVLFDALIDLALVIGLTLAVFLSLRLVLSPLSRRMGLVAHAGSIPTKVLLFVALLILDMSIVLLSWAIAYAVTVLAVGEYGSIGIRQSMYLNAFLAVESIKVVVRAFFSPTTGGLRLLPLADWGARRLNRVVNVLMSVIGYGQLVIVPIIIQGVGFGAGRSVSAIIATFVLLYLIYLVFRYRTSVVDWILTRIAPPVAEPMDLEGVSPQPPKPARRSGGFLVSLARRWHWFMLVYIAWMFFVVTTRPSFVVFDTLAASGKIALALVVAALVSSLLSRAVAYGIRLPEEITKRLPLLENRLNRFVPKALVLLRYAILLAVFGYTLNTMNAFDLDGWLESDSGLAATSAFFTVAIMVTVSFVFWLAMTSWVDYRLNPDYGHPPTARELTLLTLLRNALTIMLLILTLMFCLAEIGLNIGPLLASAGVLGLAIGFGAQKLVQDIITGVFIQFENAINVGDVITVGGVTGGVEKLTVRSVSLRDVHGVFHIIPFSSVDMVSNFTRDFSFFADTREPQPV